MTQNSIDCIVRFHKARRLVELKRCVFSLVGQNYRPLNIILALQRFTVAERKETCEALGPMLTMPCAPTLTVVNWEEPSPEDGRSVLLNLGLKTATGRYVGFLDYDDVLYPEAYELLVARLRATGAGIAFAATRVVEAEIHSHFVEVKKVITAPFSGESLRDLFRNNFCPIHSYLIDRQKVPAHILRYDETLAHEEEYDLLLRICAEVISDFALIKTQIGDYYFKTYGSNTVPTAGSLFGEKLAAYERLKTTLEARRKFTLVSPTVQGHLGLSSRRANMSIRDVMTALGTEQSESSKGVQVPQKLNESSIIEFGRCENVTARSLHFEPKAVYLEEDASFSMHRIEQVSIPVVPMQSYTVDIVARPRGRNQLMIEFRDKEQTAYARATFDLWKKRVVASTSEDGVAVGPADKEWVRCQLSLTPMSDEAVFTVTLVDHDGAPIYQGTGQGGIDIRPPIVGRATHIS